MKASQCVLTLSSIVLSSTLFAQEAPSTPAKSHSLDTKVVAGQQKWFNALELTCRKEKEPYLQFQARVSTRLLQVGQNGWEMVSISYSPLQGADCLAIGFRQPATN